MLSGLISNLHTSPKAYLAFYLAYSLSTLFDIDPELIESNLLSGAKIVLRSIQLKPQWIFFNHRSADPRVLVGQVEEVWLAWTWGGADNGTTSFVHETLLTIRGAKFRIKKATRDEKKQQQNVEKNKRFVIKDMKGLPICHRNMNQQAPIGIGATTSGSILTIIYSRLWMLYG